MGYSKYNMHIIVGPDHTAVWTVYSGNMVHKRWSIDLSYRDKNAQVEP